MGNRDTHGQIAMATEVGEILNSWTPQQRQQAFQLLVRDICSKSPNNFIEVKEENAQAMVVVIPWSDKPYIATEVEKHNCRAEINHRIATIGDTAPIDELIMD